MIVNLTSHERWKMGAGLRGGMVFYGKDLPLKDSLIARGLITEGPRHAILADLGRDALAYIDSKKTEEKTLWDVILSTVNDISQSRQEYNGTSRSVAEYTHHENGTIDCTCEYKSGNKDGSSTVFAITATLAEGRILVNTVESEDNADWFWGPGGQRDKDDPMRRVVVNGTHYYLGADKPGHGGFKGFGGRRWEIAFFDGRTVVTNDLWYQGPIPPKWRDRFPDNARFVPPPPIPSLAERLGLQEK